MLIVDLLHIQPHRNPSVEESSLLWAEEENLAECLGQEPATSCLFINHPGEGWKKNERLKNREMCAERKSEENGFFRKTEPEGRVMWESQMRKGGKQYPGKQSPCAYLTLVFYFVCLDSCFESLRVLLNVFRLFNFVFFFFFLVESFWLWPVVGSIPG